MVFIAVRRPGFCSDMLAVCLDFIMISFNVQDQGQFIVPNNRR